MSKATEVTEATSDEGADREANTPGKEKSRIRPIMNLMSMERSKHAVFGMNTVRDRLSRSSTVFSTQPDLGIVEDVYKAAFPNPTSRPTFRVITHSFGLRVGLNDSLITRDSDGTLDILPEARRGDSLFCVVWPCQGTSFLGPVSACIKGESVGDVLDERTASAQYLANKVLEVPQFQTQEPDQRTMLFLRLKKVGIISVIVPLSCILGCLTKDIFNTEAGRQIGMALMRETHEISRRIYLVLSGIPFPSGNLKDASMTKYRTLDSEAMPDMLMDIKLGRNLDLQSTSARMVRRGKQVGIATPTHEAAIKLINKIAEDHKRT